MPKIAGKEVSNIWVMVGAGVAIYLIYSVAFPPEEIAPVVQRKKPAATSKKVGQYTEADYTIRFASPAEPIRNSFRPLIIRSKSDSSSNAGGIPALFASGDGNWVYSGMATVNGVPQALLENRSTGDSEFVTRGERWKSAIIGLITADSLTLSGPGGASFTLPAGGPAEQSNDDNVNANNGIAPVAVPPGMTGQIGDNMNVRPSNGRRNRRGGN